MAGTPRTVPGSDTYSSSMTVTETRCRSKAKRVVTFSVLYRMAASRYEIVSLRLKVDPWVRGLLANNVEITGYPRPDNVKVTWREEYVSEQVARGAENTTKRDWVAIATYTV